MKTIYYKLDLVTNENSKENPISWQQFKVNAMKDIKANIRQTYKVYFEKDITKKEFELRLLKFSKEVYELLGIPHRDINYSHDNITFKVDGTTLSQASYYIDFLFE